jgi:hypothetical protein
MYILHCKIQLEIIKIKNYFYYEDKITKINSEIYSKRKSENSQRDFG